MKYLGNNSLTRILIATIALGFLSVGIISVSTMSHDSMMASKNCPITVNGGSCSQPEESTTCVDYHLGIMQNLSSAIPQGIELGIFGLMLAILFALAIFGFFDKTFRYFYRLKVRLRHLLEETVEAFQNQLGFWLVIVQKRDPSYAFALV